MICPHTCFLFLKKTGRQIRDESNELPSSQLILSGSKGIGGITSEMLNKINILDLEEDECDDESDDE